ncbi:MAG: glycosyltransferase 87 family protein, partial [Candidatus Heimdallarchaeota archaeon]
LAPPLSMYFLAVPLIIGKVFPIPLALSYRIYFSIYNILTSWLLIQIGDKAFPHNRKFMATILFGMGPFMVLQAAFAGSDESMGAFLMVLVIYLIVNNKPLAAVIFIGIGTSAKYYPSLLIPYLLATRKTFRSQIKYAILCIVSVILFFLPFYFVNPDNFMLQFNNRVKSVPWDSPGNSGLIILIEKLQIIKLTSVEYEYKIFWISSIIIISLFQIFKKYNSVEDAGLVPSIFFILYPKFFFSYFAIILPIYCLGFAYRKSPYILWGILNLGLIIGGTVNDRVFGYSSVYRQEQGDVPLLLTVGIMIFYGVWIFNWLLIFLKRDFQLQKDKAVFPQISIFNPS